MNHLKCLKHAENNTSLGNETHCELKMNTSITNVSNNVSEDIELNSNREESHQSDSPAGSPNIERISTILHTSPDNNLGTVSFNELVSKDCEGTRDNESGNDNLSVQKSRRKRIAMMDSDSEEELVSSSLAIDTEQGNGHLTVSPVVPSQTENNESVYCVNNLKVMKSSRKYFTMVDSDSEDDLVSSSLVHDSSVPNCEQQKQKKLIDSDSEDDIVSGDVEKNKQIVEESDCEDIEDVSIHNKSFADETEKIKEATIYTTNYKGELIAENYKTKKSTWTALCDPESSDEEINQEFEKPTENINKHVLDKEMIEPIPYKRKSKPKGRETRKEMTGKEAAQLRKEIQSESQRMVRETDVSLPYHRPKQFTLKEFLSRRPKLTSSLPSASKASPSLAMKMSKEQLKDILKKLENRKKELQEFYKSESEPEDDDDYKNDEDYIPPDDTSENVPHNQNNSFDNVDDSLISTHDIEMKETIQDSGIDSQDMSGNPITLDNISKESEIQHDEKEERIKTNNIGENDSLNKPEQPKTFPETIEETTADNLENQYSMDYEFNLDGVDENSERILKSVENVCQTRNPMENKDIENIIEMDILPEGSLIDELHRPVENQFSEELTNTNKPLNPPKLFDYTDLDEEIENFVNTESTDEVEKPKLSKMELIRQKISNIEPRLSGDQNHVIDLETCIPRPNQVTELMERFLQHNTKHHHKNRIKVNVVSVESGQIHKETLAMNVDDDDDPSEKELTPGAKLLKLRGELRDQIKQHRSEIWQKKAVLDNMGEEEKDPYEGEKSECGNDHDILDDDEEEEISDSSEEEEENEEEDLPEKKKSVFVDDEAEESEPDFEEDENHFEDKNDNEVVENKDNEDSASSDVEDQVQEVTANKTLKRIVKGFTEDSDDEDDDFESQKTKAIEHLNQSISEETTQDDDYIPPYQLENTKTPKKHISLMETKSDYDFLTPISYITGLQNLNSASKTKSSAMKSPLQLPNVPSPLKGHNWKSDLQKKLFTDSEITSSQADAIAEMCSNKLPDSQETTDEKSNEHKTSNFSPDSQTDLPPTLPPNTQDILNICSGDFSETAEAAIPSSLPPTSQDLLDICSGDFAAASQIREWPEKCVVSHAFRPVDEVKHLGAEEDMIISQLLDEEEMASFRRKFDSPLMSDTQRRIVEEFEEDRGGGGVIDSDDDETEGLGVRKKKSQMKLTFSDESSDDEQYQEEEIDLQDDIEEDVEDVPTDNIGYDSEENEVEYVDDDDDQQQERPKQLRTADFFENEAELSESEWGSADEDENDLDTLEFEQGDTEKFDEKQMRNELERIHMRRMLDDDTREVKLLQELLLEDGELHGSGRERQFKWKNLNSVDDDGEEKIQNEDNEAYLDEDESEEQWRRKRFEREMFLKEKQSKSQAIAEDDVEGSQFLKIGHKVIGRSQNSSQGSISIEKPAATPGSPDIKCTFSFMNKRGSFLTRNDQVLQRLAEYSKQTTNIALGTATAKNSRNFLFQTVSVEETSLELQVKKRKTSDNTPRAIKKLRLSDNLSPAVKKLERPSAKAKLFGNL